jgi:hypothetical protein
VASVSRVPAAVSVARTVSGPMRLALAIAETDGVPPEVAKLRGIALSGVFQIIIAEAGRRTREGQTQNQIANELRPAIEAALDDLDRWLTKASD